MRSMNPYIRLQQEKAIAIATVVTERSREHVHVTRHKGYERDLLKVYMMKSFSPDS